MGGGIEMCSSEHVWFGTTKSKLKRSQSFLFYFIIEILKLLAAVITKSKTLQQKLDESALVSKMM